MKCIDFARKGLALGLCLSFAACGPTPSNPTPQNSLPPQVSASPQSTPSSQSTPSTGNKKIVTVGISQFAQHPSLDNIKDGIVAGLAENGFVEGDNLKIVFQNAQADFALANTIAANFVSTKVDLIAAIATPSAQTAFNAASPKKIPVVFSAVSDPLASQIVASLEVPGGVATGTSDTLQVEAQLKMIRAFLPNAKKIGILHTTSEVNSTSQLKKYQLLAPEYGFEIVEKGINTAKDIPVSVDAMLPQVDCFTNLLDNTVVTSLATIIDKTNAKKIPVFGSEVEQLKSGCLAAEGLDYFEGGKQSGEMAAKILNGADPATMPVKTMDKSNPAVNKKASEKLGIAIPESYASAEVVDTAQ